MSWVHFWDGFLSLPHRVMWFLKMLKAATVSSFRTAFDPTNQPPGYHSLTRRTQPWEGK